MSPAPLSLWHCDPELCSIEKRFNWKDGPFHGPSYTIESQWGKFSTLPCPPGVQLLPHFEVWSYRACQPLQMWQISHFCEIHSLSYEASNFFRNVKSMGQIWDAPAPQGCNFYPIWGMVLQSLPASSNVAKFHILWNPLSELRGVNFFAMLSQCVWFCPYFAPGANIVPPIAYKSHSTRFPIRPHVLTPHSWLCDKTVGGVARRNKSGRRIIITRMYISRRKCEMVLAVAKNTTRLLGGC